jgi:hypothetical protein
MMVTGDHYMTASAVAHSLGIFEKGGKRVLLDMIVTKPAASEAPANAPLHVSKATAAVASRFGGTQHNHQDPSQAALRHSVAQHSRLTVTSSPSSRVTFLLNPNEDSKIAAVRASLEESLRTPSASPAAASAQQAPAVSASRAAAPSQQAPAVSAAANACQLSARSFSCAPAVQAADAAASPAASPAATIAASSALFRSSSLQAASPTAATSAATSAASPAASPAPAKAPSPLLGSYLQSMGMAKAAPQAQAGSAQAQAGSAQAQQVSAQAQAGSAQAQAGSAQAQPASAQAQAGSAQAQAGSAQAAPLHAQSRFANR